MPTRLIDLCWTEKMMFITGRPTAGLWHRHCQNPDFKTQVMVVNYYA